jgi:hypothetical protein
MVVEMSPWSSNLGLNKWSRTLFLFKNRPFQSYGLYSSASVEVKTGSPDPADFAKTRHQLPRLWHIPQNPLAYRTEVAAISQGRTNNCANCQHWPSGFLPKLAQVSDPFFAALAVRAVVVRPWHIKAGTVTESFFKQNKGSATISLGLIYHSMVLSQPPSRDTVPLLWEGTEFRIRQSLVRIMIQILGYVNENNWSWSDFYQIFFRLWTCFTLYIPY